MASLDEIDVCCSGDVLVVSGEADEREQGLLVLRGVATHALAEAGLSFTESDVVLLAAEIAVPGQFVIRRGVTPLLDRYRYTPLWFLRAWEKSVTGAPSSPSLSR